MSKILNPKKVSIEDFDIFIPTKKIINRQLNSKVLISGLLRRGQLSILAAPSNGGKSTKVFFHDCKKLVKKGYTVIYLDADSTALLWPVYKYYSNKNGFKWLNPIASKQSIESMVNYLRALKGNLKNVVFIIDTLKRFTDLMQKNAIKDFTDIMQGLIGKGASCLLLSHTNKYMVKNEKGELEHKYEGTNDLENNCDAMIYLYFKRDEEKKIQTLSFYPDKTRGSLKNITIEMKRPDTFEISNCENLMKEVPFVDIKKQMMPWKPNKQLRNKGQIINEFKDVIKEKGGSVELSLLKKEGILSIKESGLFIREFKGTVFSVRRIKEKNMVSILSRRGGG